MCTVQISLLAVSLWRMDSLLIGQSQHWETLDPRAERGQVRVCPIRDLGFQGESEAFAMAGKNLGRQKRRQFVCSLGEYKFSLSFLG